MGRPATSFPALRKRDCERTLEMIRSRPEGVTSQDVHAYWRRLGSSGHAANVLAWLQDDGLITLTHVGGSAIINLTEKGMGL